MLRKLPPLLCAISALSAAAVGPSVLAPTSVVTGRPTTVLVTSTITDEGLQSATVNLQRLDAAGRVLAVVGTLRDDGKEGDAAAGDKVFSLRFVVFENTPGPLQFRVSAGFAGSLTRVFSTPMTLSVTGTGTGIQITAPANLQFLNTSPVIVTGNFGDPNAVVTINGLNATKNGTSFQVSVPLVEGNNTLTAVAKNSNNTTNTSSIQVTLDTTPPQVAITAPGSGLVVNDATVTVTGNVNDIVAGTVNDKQAQVTVNGIVAVVSNRTFTAAGVPVQLGNNLIQALARDQVGNSATTSVNITRQAPPVLAIRKVSGDSQAGPIGALLPQPMMVQLLNNSVPVPNAPVVFKVVQNDGYLQPGTNKPASIVVNTNAQGMAQASLVLGTRSGAGNNAVEATATGFTGLALFTASGQPKQAAKINVDSGNSQIGTVGQPLPLPFVAIVTDSGNNRIGGVPVTFSVRAGGGTIKGANTTTAVSDSDGRAVAVLTLGSQPGQDSNVVEATFTGNSGLPAAFTASAKVPGNPELTKISGVVLDNSNNPIPNVSIRLFLTNQGGNNNQPVQLGTPVKTNAQGFFAIQPAPVGFFKLMADGSTAGDAQKSFPTLEYDLLTVAGQDNTLGMPIYLPVLDQLAKVCVTETTGGTLTSQKLPGFSLKIAPGGATFPGGTKTGCVSVSGVNPDKVPMTPGFGQQPRFIVTIQPVGTVFSPPAAITMPNVDGLAPRSKTEMYSYDHDLAAFVALGSATVSEDGALIVSDAGVGVIKAGWHCGGNPNTSGSAGTCATCYKCQGSSCIPADGQSCNDNNPCTINDKCQSGVCKGELKVAKNALRAAALGATAEADSCPVPKVEVQSASINPNQFKVFAGPSYPDPVGGPLEVTLLGREGTADHVVMRQTVVASDDARVFTFDIEALPKGKYRGLVAKWTINDQTLTSAEFAYRANVKGTYRHTQYNSPVEPDCRTAPTVKIYVVTPTAAGNIGPNHRCWNPDNYTSVTVKTTWTSAVDQQGNGRLNSGGAFLQRFPVCATGSAIEHTDKRPQDATASNTFIQVPVTRLGSCGTALVSGQSVATSPADSDLVAAQPGRLNCGKQIYIHSVGVKTVSDNCPGCASASSGTDGKMDNFTLGPGCSDGSYLDPRLLDLGNFKTIILEDGK